jgi:class 3 adenylate cyclase/CheY-like chemotaxis protein
MTEARTDAPIEPVVLVVDDLPANLRLMEAVLAPRGHRVITAASGRAALDVLVERDVDIVLLDILMPEMDGYEVCRRIRSDARTAFLPVVMVTASGDQEKLSALSAGADDFLTKPIDQAELVARVASLVRIRRYHDTIVRQSAELAEWNRELEDRVGRQVAELERMGRLRRFLSPQVAESVLSAGIEGFAGGHRRDIAVVFADLRGFTTFAETAEPEEVWEVLREYHQALGDLAMRYDGTVERFTGDGIMVFFNDPLPVDDAPLRAVRLGVAMRGRVQELAEHWQRRGHDLALGVGIAQGYATCGLIGFEGRVDYAAIGTVTNTAARLCAAAEPWQVLVTQRVRAAAEEIAVTRPVGELALRGLARAVPTFDVVGIDAARVSP